MNRWFRQVRADAMWQFGRGWFQCKCCGPQWYRWFLPVTTHLFKRHGLAVAICLLVLQGLTVAIHCLSLNFCSKWVAHNESL